MNRRSRTRPVTGARRSAAAKAPELEARIAKAIQENTCPHTTDADIRYFETEEYNERTKSYNDYSKSV
jgi:hypothetical protein